MTLQANGSVHQFQIDRKGAFSSDYEIKSPSGGVSFYVDVSSWTPGKPDLTLHQGGSKHGKVVAACHFPSFSGDLKLGFAGPAGSDSMEWEDVTKESVFKSSEYRWEAAIPDLSPGRKVLLWKRTHSVAVTGSSPSALSDRNWKLVDEETGGILAVFTNKHSMSKCGTLEIRENYGGQFDQMVLIGCLAL
ncbi:hypothetical protein ACJZ2D_014663 [Fusarium nematophilum]